MMVTTLFGKTYAWIRAPRTGQWQLCRLPDLEDRAAWDALNADVLGDVRRALQP